VQERNSAEPEVTLLPGRETYRSVFNGGVKVG
jgi:hypothetical protein